MDQRDFLQRVRGTRAELVRMRDHAESKKDEAWTGPLSEVIVILDNAFADSEEKETAKA